MDRHRFDYFCNLVSLNLAVSSTHIILSYLNSRLTLRNLAGNPQKLQSSPRISVLFGCQGGTKSDYSGLEGCLVEGYLCTAFENISQLFGIVRWEDNLFFTQTASNTRVEAFYQPEVVCYADNSNPGPRPITIRSYETIEDLVSALLYKTVNLVEDDEEEAVAFADGFGESAEDFRGGESCEGDGESYVFGDICEDAVVCVGVSAVDVDEVKV
jgi:hypothetical protein